MRTAIVTGATSGIGRAAALRLGEEGYWVLAHGRDPERGRDVEGSLMKGTGGQFFAGDLAEEGIPEALVERAITATGRLDLLVNNAGTHFLASVDKTDPGELERLLAVNTTAPFLLARASIPAMRAVGGGVIVNVSSEAGIVAVPGQVAYNVSKAALLMLTRSIAVDHASEGIRAVSICPGTTHTPLVDRAIKAAPDPEAHERWLASSRPLNRLGTEQEIANVIVWAASEEASFVTGTEIVVDGGYTAV
jgi:NAD(P)-dependent dehydrogenase (short-subunit alcohol dehydrogenase family)